MDAAQRALECLLPSHKARNTKFECSRYVLNTELLRRYPPCGLPFVPNHNSIIVVRAFFASKNCQIGILSWDAWQFDMFALLSIQLLNFCSWDQFLSRVRAIHDSNVRTFRARTMQRAKHVPNAGSDGEKSAPRLREVKQKGGKHRTTAQQRKFFLLESTSVRNAPCLTTDEKPCLNSQPCNEAHVGLCSMVSRSRKAVKPPRFRTANSDWKTRGKKSLFGKF